MIAVELINNSLPVAKPKDTCVSAQELMMEFKLSALPVVDNGKYLGLITESFIEALDTPEDKIQKYTEGLPQPFLFEDQHLFDALKLVDSFRVNLIVVLDKQSNYLGAFSVSTIVHAMTALSAVQQPGGILVLEMNPADYSMTQISQIVEGNDARILACYTAPQQASNKIDVTIKINREDLSAIIQTFGRFNYVVKAAFHQSEFDEDMRKRFELFMNYINM